VLLFLAVTGPQWAFTPWFAAVALLLLAGLGAYALGLLDPHHARKDGSKRGIRTTRREREGRVSASEAAAQEAWDAMLAEYRPLAIAPPVQHSANWGEPRTDLIDYESLPAFTPDLDGPPAGCPEPLPPLPQVTVTDNPPAGKHEKPRAYQFQSGERPYCGNCGTAGHWRGDPQCTGDIVVDDLIARRRDGTVALAIAGYVAEAGYRSHGGDTDAMLDSIIGGIEPVQS
jgi:hypothetical protein